MFARVGVIVELVGVNAVTLGTTVPVTYCTIGLVANNEVPTDVVTLTV